MVLTQTRPSVVAAAVLDTAEYEQLLAEFAAIRASDFECEEKPNALTHGTLWMPSAAAACPGNAIEAYIARVSGSAGFEAATGGGFVGAEWWWQETDAGDQPKCFHTDCDLLLNEDNTNTKVHPAVSSVFYTSEVGGPTVILDQVVESGDLVPETPTATVLSFPHPNQLTLFCGALNHGVLHPPPTYPFPPPPAERVTLLVNWWTERPNGPSDLPEEFNTRGRPLRLPDSPAAAWPASSQDVSFAEPACVGETQPYDAASIEERFVVPPEVLARLGAAEGVKLPPAVIVRHAA